MKQPNQALETLMSPREAMQTLSLSRRTLRRYEVSGKLPPIKLNARVTRYRLKDVAKLASGN